MRQYRRSHHLGLYVMTLVLWAITSVAFLLSICLPDVPQKAQGPTCTVRPSYCGSPVVDTGPIIGNEFGQ